MAFRYLRVCWVVMLALPLSAAAQQLSLESIIDRVEQAQVDARENIRPYTVTREYQLFNGEQERPASQVVADISFAPPTNRDYTIRHSSGNGQGEKVVKKVLDHENEAAADWQKHAINRQNYDFDLRGRQVVNGKSYLVLGLNPKREAKDLLHGVALVDPDTFHVARVTGEPSKSPSFWIKRVEITVDYGNVDGMWLQKSARAQADVRIFGAHTLVSHDVDCRAATVVANVRHPGSKPPTRYHRPTASFGSAISR